MDMDNFQLFGLLVLSGLHLDGAVVGTSVRMFGLTFGLSGKCSDSSMSRHFCRSSSERTLRPPSYVF